MEQKKQYTDMNVKELMHELPMDLFAKVQLFLTDGYLTEGGHIVDVIDLTTAVIAYIWIKRELEAFKEIADCLDRLALTDKLEQYKIRYSEVEL